MTKDPMVRLSRAEQALAEAGDIIDILDLRTKAKAIQVIAIAENLGDLAQQAKVFQIKAERKAGLWLGENIHQGRPSLNGRLTLVDLEISYSDSSRWQLMATVPDEKFFGWLDERMAKGQEITAGGLRQYARNIKGIKVSTSSLPNIIIINPQGMACALRGYRMRCEGPPTGGHIINKTKTKGNPEGRAILVAQAAQFAETRKAEIMTWQCASHNVERVADEPEAVRIMLIQKIYEYGWFHMKHWFDEFLGTYKVHPTNLELERLLEPRKSKL